MTLSLSLGWHLAVILRVWVYVHSSSCRSCTQQEPRGTETRAFSPAVFRLFLKTGVRPTVSDWIQIGVVLSKALTRHLPLLSAVGATPTASLPVSRMETWAPAQEHKQTNMEEDRQALSLPNQPQSHKNTLFFLSLSLQVDEITFFFPHVPN